MAQTLSDQIAEERSVQRMKLKLVGLYLLAARGGDTEKLIIAANGLDSGTVCPVPDCQDLWNTLVNKCVLYCFCGMSLGFLTESALIPQKSKEIKIDPGIVFGPLFC